jgi:NADH-quinone oxidoreductase subunit G
MIEACPALGAIDDQGPGEWGDFGVEGAIDSTPFESAVANFYMTDPISRASLTMAKCTAEFGMDASSERTEAHA